MSMERVTEILFSGISAVKAALDQRSYRDASAFVVQLHGFFTEREKDAKDEIEKNYATGCSHLLEAEHSNIWFEEAKAEKAANNELEQMAAKIVDGAQSAIRYFVEAKEPIALNLAYDLLFTGHEDVIVCRAARLDLVGVSSTVDDFKKDYDQFRKLGSGANLKPYIVRIRGMQIVSGMSAGMQAMINMDLLAAKSSFKTAEDIATNLMKETNESANAVLAPLLPLVKGLDALTEGTLQHELGNEPEAASTLREAEQVFKQIDQAKCQGFARWAGGLSRLCLGNARALDGRFDAAIREYQLSAETFLEGADVFPSDDPGCISLAGRMRFYADAAKSRANDMRARRERQRREFWRSKQFGGLLFFALWLVAIAVLLVLARTIDVGVDARVFFLVLLIAFPAAGLAAVLIGPKEAFDYLRNLMPQFKGD